MINVADCFAASQRDRWMQPDAARWIRPDASRFLAPGTRAVDAFPALDRKFNPNQPRVPAGNPDGGQWTDGGGGGGGYNDPRVISDADPESILPGQQYAQNRRRGGNSVLINGQPFELSAGQAARLTIARARAESAIARVRKVQSDWKPPPSIYQTPEGLIRAYEADAAAARARAAEMSNGGALPGPYAGEWIDARGPGRNFTAAERREINRIGRETGCHTCGTFDPGTKLGNFIPDHQIPSALNSSGRAQRLYPHCLGCSVRQGAFVRGLRRR